ncbi:MAG: WHG domain-containing protein [Actinobacteria bacterium]|nr:WHG domain-containing protein [Actinomycetota bacterium]
MAARVGLDRGRVVDVAVELVERGAAGESPVLAEVAARLGVRTQSLYAHVNGVEDLRRELALRGLRALTARLTGAAVGRAGTDALDAIARAWLSFAGEHPGLYAASLRAPGQDPELREAVAAAMAPLQAVFRSWGLADDDAAHWYRTIFAAVHGFATLRSGGMFTLPVDVDETATRMIGMFVRGVERDARPRRAR